MLVKDVQQNDMTYVYTVNVTLLDLTIFHQIWFVET